MAGQASRIYNFCHSKPNSPGCPWPSYLGNQQPAKICDNFPFEIGTSNDCSVYNVYWIRAEYVEADVTISGWAPAGSSGTTFNLVAPLYSGIYSSSDLSSDRNKIGYFKLITSQFQYDTSEKILNTDNYSFYWINEDNIVASMDSIYDYIGIEGNPFFTDNSTHYFNSTTSAYQLLNKSLSIQLYAGVDERQCKLTIKNI
jgi:hypothetical protein